jgi:hypothetical protein
MLVLLDKAFFVLHTMLLAFNMVGWAWRRTRSPHLIALGLTAFSWFVLGAYYGWGYCLCTDWHLQVRRQLGYPGVESSYVQLLASELFGATMSRTTSDWLAGGVFALIVIATAVAWGRDWQRRRGLRHCA